MSPNVDAIAGVGSGYTCLIFCPHPNSANKNIRVRANQRPTHTHTAAKCQVHQCDQWKCSVSLDSFLVTFVDGLLRWSTMNSSCHRRFMTLRYKPLHSQIASRTLLKLLFVTLVNFRRGEVGVGGWTGKRWFITPITWQLRYFRWVIVLIYNMFWLTALSRTATTSYDDALFKIRPHYFKCMQLF